MNRVTGHTQQFNQVEVDAILSELKVALKKKDRGGVYLALEELQYLLKDADVPGTMSTLHQSL